MKDYYDWPANTLDPPDDEYFKKPNGKELQDDKPEDKTESKDESIEKATQDKSKGRKDNKDESDWNYIVHEIQNNGGSTIDNWKEWLTDSDLFSYSMKKKQIELNRENNDIIVNVSTEESVWIHIDNSKTVEKEKAFLERSFANNENVAIFVCNDKMYVYTYVDTGEERKRNYFYVKVLFREYDEIGVFFIKSLKAGYYKGYSISNEKKNLIKVRLKKI